MPDDLMMLANADCDLGLAPAAAHDLARQLAAQDQVVITLRDPLTDTLLATCNPPAIAGQRTVPVWRPCSSK